MENEKNPLFTLIEQVEKLVQEQKQVSEKNERTTEEIMRLTQEVSQIPKEVENAHVEGVRSAKIAISQVNTDLSGIGEKFNQAINSAAKRIQDAELKLSDKDRKSLADTESQIKRFKTLSYLFGGLVLLSALTLLGSGYMAKKWYNTSVQTKQEVREEILQQIQNEGSIIISEAEYTALRHEKELLKGWYEANPEDRKSYNTHRKAIINLEQNQERLFFESPASDEIGKGGKSGFFD